MLGSLTKGADLTSMIVSASLLKPYSSLQKLGTDMMSRSNYLPEIVACKDPLERSLMVAKFFISGFHPDTFDGKKPFNPILGEQCHHVFNHGEEFGKSYYFSEQVSHHPPIFAAHVVNDKIGVKATLTGKTKVIFGGNFIDVKFPGHKEIYFKEHDELYTIETPFLCVRGVMGIGKKGIERSGQLIVRCEKTGYVTKVHFKPLGFLGLWGTWNAVDGHTKLVTKEKGKKKKELLKTFDGYWTSTINVTDAKSGEKEVFYDYEGMSKYNIKPVEIPLEKRSKLDSGNVWRKAIEGILSGDMKSANEGKHEVEVHQRELRARLKKEGKKHEHAFFDSIKDDHWVPKEEAVAQYILSELSVH
uniref:Oxysterol binding protein n=2 Tax=Palpitomonas bilix TaxID=652834 RepID=A0A7S3D5Z6_9EUKA